jgi:hypothetical protein
MKIKIRKGSYLQVAEVCEINPLAGSPNFWTLTIVDFHFHQLKNVLFFTASRPALHRRLFPQGQSGSVVNLATHLNLGPRLRMMELFFQSSIHLNSVMLN